MDGGSALATPVEDAARAEGDEAPLLGLAFAEEAETASERAPGRGCLDARHRALMTRLAYRPVPALAPARFITAERLARVNVAAALALLAFAISKSRHVSDVAFMAAPASAAAHPYFERDFLVFVSQLCQSSEGIQECDRLLPRQHFGVRMQCNVASAVRDNGAAQ